MSLFKNQNFLLLIALLSISNLYSENLDVSVLTGVNYYEISTSDNNISSNAYTSDVITEIQADWIFMENFFLGAKGRLPVAKEHSRESLYFNDRKIQNNLMYYDEKNLELYGGYQIISLINPFIGFAISTASITRSGNLSSNTGILTDDQKYNNYDFLFGLKGSLDFNDYTSVGYSLTYAKSPYTSAELNSKDFDDIDSSKIASTIFIKYWLPNELMQIGLHLYGGKSFYDKQSAQNDLLPDTDIKFIGAFLSFKVNL